ncbi:hypothetical protein GUJ93_ZPchr0007g5487 [Zizania palustris]|uniref:Pre-mRNA processing factor 4 (PRP4)-like domain-containing protein n=1 Tax=Zizania palustris TaxID=103762 RepID=A0A8J5T7F7_ZIZPA|nr:hypothetical protein GUJ93_ZPchr0007g5487 [Zizania palustris]
MDLLKRELEKKRKAATADFGGKSFVRRSELEQKQLQKRRHEEHRQLLAKAPTATSSGSAAASDPNNPNADPTQSSVANSSSSANPNPSSSLSGSAASLPPGLAGKKPTQDEALLGEERRIDELDLPRHEVVRRLRILREPVTLFGEDDAARLARLKFVLKSGVIDDIDMTEGQTNDFLRDMVELRQRQKAGRDTYVKGKGKGKGKRVGGGDGGDGGAAGDNADVGDGDAQGSGDDADVDEDSKRMKTKFEDLCDEDKILVFFKRLLIEWNQELDEMAEQKRTAKGKSMVATFKQCARYLSPLFEFCRKQVRSFFCIS